MRIPRSRDIRGRPPLFLAAGPGNDLETVRLLVAAGADVNDVTPRQEHLLVTALYSGRKEIIDFLLDSGARLPDSEPTISQAIHVSASNGLDRVFAIAVEMADRKDWRGGRASPPSAQLAADRWPLPRRFWQEAERSTRRTSTASPRFTSPPRTAADRSSSSSWPAARDRRADPDGQDGVAPGAGQRAGGGGGPAQGQGRLAGAAPVPGTQRPVLGQPPPGDAPERFALGIVSGHGFDSEHSPVAFSPDGTEAYWTPKFKGPMVFMNQERGVWTPPRPVPFGSNHGDGEPIFSPDGRRLYFLSLRPIAPSGATDKENIWYVERTASGWSEPRPVSPLVNAFNHHWLFSVSSSGTLYFSSIRDGGDRRP